MRSRLTTVVALAAAVSVAVAVAASASGSASTGRLEVDVMNEPVRGGEPEMAVDPRNPQDVVLGHTVVGNTYANNAPEAGEEAVDGGLQVSHDGGATWSADRALHTSGYSEGPNPYLLAHGFSGATGFTQSSDGVGDPIEASGPDGSIYAGGVLAHTTPGGPPPFGFTVPQGGIAVARSTNGGRSFGPISAVLTDQELQGMVARGMTPNGIGAFGVNPFDRPWITVDQSTGAVYVSTTAHPQRYVAVSRDKARTWGTIEALDCDEATPPRSDHAVTCNASPQVGDGNIAAAHGVLAAGYTASAAPGSSCPCVVFETSTDAGAHWDRHVVVPSVSGAGVVVAADPAHKGRFAVLLLPSAQVPGGLSGLPAGKNVPQEIRILTTSDSGRTWSTPVTMGDESVAHITNRPWIAYGPTGILAVSWRNAYPPFNPKSFLTPGTQNVFAAISRDNGKSFSAAVQLNSSASPPPDPTQLAEDDVGWVTVTKQYVYGAWGDWRPTSKNPVAPASSPQSGELNAWIARVPLAAFGRGAGSSTKTGKTAATAAHSFKSGDRYVALGSSIASGFGISVQSTACGRSNRNYPNLIAEHYHLQLVDVTCGAAAIRHVLDQPEGDFPPQIDAVTPDTKLVTITVGGNDIGYNATAVSCGDPTTECAAPATLDADLARDRADLSRLISRVKAAAPQATIVFVTYPREVPATGNCPELSFSDSEAAIVRDIGDRLEQLFVDVVQPTGVVFVDPYVAPGDHTGCAAPDQRWVAGHVPDDGFAYHPTVLGHQVMAQMIVKALGG